MNPIFPLLSRFLGVTGLLFLVSILYYVYQLVLNHGLPMAEYGLMSSILAWTVLAAFPSSILKIFLTRYVTLHRSEPEKKKSFIYNSFWKTLSVSWYVLLGFLLLGIFIAPRLEVSYLIYVLVALSVFFTLIMNFFRAISYIDGRFSIYAKSATLEIVFRIVVSYLILTTTTNIPLLYAIYLISIILSLVYFRDDIRFMMQKSSKWKFEIDEVIEMKKQLLPMSFISVFLIALGTLEVIIASQILSKDELGKFSTLIIIGKLILTGLGVWTSVGMPYFSQPKNHKKHLTIIYLLHCITVTFTLIFFYFFGGGLIRSFFSPLYECIVPYVMSMTIAMLLMGSMSMIIQHLSLVGNRYAGYLSLLIPVVSSIYLIGSDNTLESVVQNLLYGYIAGSILWTFLFLIIFFAKRNKILSQI